MAAQGTWNSNLTYISNDETFITLKIAHEVCSAKCPKMSQIPSAVRPSAPLALHLLAHQGDGALPSRLLHNCKWLIWRWGYQPEWSIMCLTLSLSCVSEMQYTYFPFIPFVAGLLSGEIWYWTLQYLSWQQLAASECTLESKANRKSYTQMRGTISNNECEASVRSSWIQKLMAMVTASVHGNVSPQEKLTINPPKISQVPTELSLASSSGSSGTDSAFSSGTSCCSCWNNASRDSSHSQLEPYQTKYSWTSSPKTDDLNLMDVCWIEQLMLLNNIVEAR